MRKLLGLVMLVPFAAILVLSCDDHPTAPETAEAATTVQESSTPQATKAPTLPTPVRLSGYVRSYDDVVEVAPGDPGFSLAVCPTGTVAITGGFDTGGLADFVLTRSNPEMSLDGESAWMVGVKNESSTETLYFRAVVACVEGTIAQ